MASKWWEHLDTSAHIPNSNDLYLLINDGFSRRLTYNARQRLMRPNAISSGRWMLPDTTLGLFITTNVLAYLELDPLDQIPSQFKLDVTMIM